MSEMAPGGRLQCASLNHPRGSSTDTMFFLEENNGFFCFACRLCTETFRKPQLHVIAKSSGAVLIHKNTRKAASIDRDASGRIVSFR